ncbi:sugar ABC transporter substrate-binding protein [Rhodococcoides trifolii]|uniref:Sugar ABC transporter substrate-binding protein n=2 Tax=Rhodococcoides trifolii TaxID=908250 RepID=A0A917G7A1_9NOCA|nr:sugar ABC transporter substrate-binding protein [Rhodococcus trifolii]
MAAGSADTPKLTIAMITHGVPGNAFWDVVQKGAEAAAAKDNVELRYTSDPQAPNQANLVQSAIDSKVDGIAVTLAKPDAMKPAVAAAEAAGIPVVGLNSGLSTYKEMGVQQYFGQDEDIAGQSAGERLAQDGAKKVLCVVHEQGNVSLEARCAGIAQKMPGAVVESFYVNSQDMPSVEALLTAKLQQDPTFDTIATLDSSIGHVAVQSKAATGVDAKIVTFGIDAETVKEIRNGDVVWANDQQPFLQGYLAVDSLWLYLNNGNTIGGGEAVLTGPAFIDESNIDAVADYAAAGTR